MHDLGLAVVIEDDMDVRNLIVAVLMQAGFQVREAHDGLTGVALARDTRPNVVTLDVGMPDIDGFEALRRIRLFSDAYVLMLTGRGDESDVLTALHAGADDYIIKPFRPRELRARITAMLRRPRTHGTETAAEPPAPSFHAPPARQGSVLQHNGLALDHAARTVTVDGRGLDLTRSEFDLLHDLLRSRGAVRSRRQLVETLREGSHGDAYIGEADERAVEAHIGNLRRKLQDDPRSPRWLQTVRGVGYCLARRAAADSN